MRSLTRREVEVFYDARCQEVRTTTANKTLKDIKRLFAVAMDWGYVDANPATRIHMKDGKALPVRLPSSEEVSRLLELLARRLPWMYRLVLFLLSTGCRLGEALGVDWSDIDMASSRLVLRRSKVQDTLVFTVTGSLKDELWKHWMAEGQPRQGLVFPSPRGAAYTRTGVLSTFKRTVRALGMPWMCLRTFRKLAATTVAEKTGDARMAQHLLGHTSLRTTELYLGRQEQARKAAGEVMGRWVDGAVGRKVGMFPVSEDRAGSPIDEKVKV
jgi:integrase